MWVPTPAFLYRNYRYLKIASSLPKDLFFLDIGPGNGWFLKKISELGFKGEAIEISNNALKLVRRQIKDCKGVSVKKGDILKSRISKKYDLIFSFEVLEHIKDDRRAIKRVYSLLKPGGLFVMSVPAHTRLWTPLDKMKGHYRRYERGELKTKLENTGFRISSIETYGFPFLLLLRMIAGSGRFLKTSTLSANKDKRSQDSGIQEEYNPRLRYILGNPVLLYPFFKIMDIFLRTDWGLGYLVVAKKV